MEKDTQSSHGHMVQNLDKSYRISDVLPVELFMKLWEENLDPTVHGWTLNNRSYSNDMGSVSWRRADKYLDPDVMLEVSECIGGKIEEETGHKLYWERCHVNGQTAGQISSIHTDYRDTEHITAILFCCPQWNTQWGGTFMVYDENLSKYEYYSYLPNSAAIIPSQWEHFGESPNHFTHEMRVTIAFMFKIVG